MQGQVSRNHYSMLLILVQLSQFLNLYYRQVEYLTPTISYVSELLCTTVHVYKCIYPYSYKILATMHINLLVYCSATLL